MEKKCSLCNKRFNTIVPNKVGFNSIIPNKKYCSNECKKLYANYLDYCKRSKNISFTNYLRMAIPLKIKKNMSVKFKRRFLFKDYNKINTKVKYYIEINKLKRMYIFIRRKTNIKLKLSIIQNNWNKLAIYKNNMNKIIKPNTYLIEELV